MIHFVVVVGTPDAVDRLRSRLAPALEATRLQDGERIEHVGAARTWAIAAIAKPDRMCSTRLAVTDDAMVVANGPFLATSGDQQRALADLLERFQASGSAAVTTGLGGSYNFVGIAPSIGVRALADFSGLCPLYWHQGDDFALFSNRTSTIDHLLELGWDLRPFAWVIGHANLFDDHMPVQRVSYLPPGLEARVAVGDTQVELARSSSWFWPPASTDRGRDNLDPHEWDEVTDAMIANFRALRGLEGPLGLSLTGGKDSRLCLALAHAAGLDDRIRTMTAGAFDSPEVACAATVAAALGFPHDAAQPPTTPADPQKVPAPPPFNADRVWKLMRQNVYRYEGIVTAWSAFQNPTNPQLNIKGFGGELYRRGNAKQFGDKHFDNLETLASMFVNYHQVHDPLGVLQSREAEYQTEWLKAWVYDTAEHVRIDLLPEKFYVDFRLGHWSGPLEQDAPARVNVNPLLLTLAAGKNTELSAAARGSERFHFEVMRRAAPELVGLPFLNDTWSPAIAAGSPIELATEPFPVEVKPIGRVITGRNQGWRLMEHDAKGIEALFKEAGKTTDMGRICDIRKLRRVARRAPQLTKSAEVKELHSAVGVALALLGRAEPVLDP
jgi:hypothetical protein